MFTLLVIIYVAFISLGLPDALLGSSWTIIHHELNAPIAMAGVIGMVIAGGTIVSSLLTSRLLKRFGTGIVVTVSVALTALALAFFSIAGSVMQLIVFAIPLGLGAGAVDATLNNFVALNYKSKHMNWLHSFWGIGAAGGPLILAVILKADGGWRDGYSAVSVIQVVLVAILVASLPLWKRVKTISESEDNSSGDFISNRKALQIKGVKISLITFFCYCSLEAGTGLWAATYLTTEKGVSPVNAALWTSIYYGGITVGRLLSGILSEKFSSQRLIRSGLVLITVGVTILILSKLANFSLVGLILIGLGCAPIYPGLIHLTPSRFSKRASQSVLGLSMAFAYVGSTFMPPILGGLSSLFGFGILPYVLFLLVTGMFISNEWVVRYIDISSKKELSEQRA